LIYLAAPSTPPEWTHEALVEGVLHGRDTRLRARLVRGLLTPLAWLHQIGLETYLLPYRMGLRRRCRLRHADGRPVRVVSIGNLASGGTGKTPMAALVARRLGEEAKCRVVVLSRGHGGTGDREGDGAPRIVSDGARMLLGPDEAGDEPVLLAQLLPGVPVIIGRDRRRSGRLAVQRFAPDVIVLDDALQFWQLERDLDIVLLDARRPFDNGHVLPRGLLREPPRHLKRAHVVVLTRADRVAPSELEETRRRIARIAPQAEVFTATHAPTAWVRLRDNALLPLDALRERDVSVFAGIADFDSFVHSVEALGARTVVLRRFGDHHVYEADELASVAEKAAGLDAVVTTEKDAVKVAPLWPSNETAPPLLLALRIALKLDDTPRLMRRLRAVAGRRRSPPPAP